MDSLRKRKTNRDVVFGEKAQPRLNAIENRLPMCNTQVRPYISESGAMIKGWGDDDDDDDDGWGQAEG